MAQPGSSAERPTPATPLAGLPPGDLPLSAERLLLLEPKLRALLLDFQQLEALEQPELEPLFDAVNEPERDDVR